MSKKDDTTIENRVYLFESLASSYVATATELLGADDPAVRERARRALSELAYVSCVVADTAHLTPEQVRDRVMGAPAPVPPLEEVSPADRDRGSKKRNK